MTGHNVAMQKRSLEITQQIFKAGEDSELDVQQAKTQYLVHAVRHSGPRSDVDQAAQRAGGAARSQRPASCRSWSRSPAPLPAIEPLVIQGIPSDLLLRRPDIRSSAWRIAAQSAQIGVAKADYFPAISLLGTIGWSGNSLGGSPTPAVSSSGRR